MTRRNPDWNSSREPVKIPTGDIWLAVIVGTIVLVVCLLFLQGCAATTFSESYGDDGALLARQVSFRGLGTVKQASYTADQTEARDGSAFHNVTLGEDMSVDPQVKSALSTLANAGLGVYGLRYNAENAADKARLEAENRALRSRLDELTRPVEVHDAP